jgi:hypothetical protein
VATGKGEINRERSPELIENDQKIIDFRQEFNQKLKAVTGASLQLVPERMWLTLSDLGIKTNARLTRHELQTRSIQSHRLAPAWGLYYSVARRIREMLGLTPNLF